MPLSGGWPPVTPGLTRAANPCPPSQEQRQRDVNVAGEFLRRSPVLIGDDQFFPLEQFLVPHHYKDALKEIMIPHGLIVDRCVAVIANS